MELLIQLCSNKNDNLYAITYKNFLKLLQWYALKDNTIQLWSNTNDNFDVITYKIILKIVTIVCSEVKYLTLYGGGTKYHIPQLT